MDHLVDFSHGNIIKVHADEVLMFPQIASKNEKKRYRLCLHQSPQDKLQEMLICMEKGEYVRPHKHRGLTESNTIILGTKMTVIFDDDGEIFDTYIMNSRDGYISSKIKDDLYHMDIILSDSVVFYEVRLGPFNPAVDNIFPDWAPDGTNETEVNEYMNRTMEKCKEWIKNSN